MPAWPDRRANFLCGLLMRHAHGCASASRSTNFSGSRVPPGKAARLFGGAGGPAPSAGRPAAVVFGTRVLDIGHDEARLAAHPSCAPHPQSNFYIDPSTLAAGVCDGADDTPSAAARPVRAYPALHVAKALPYHADTHPRARLPLPCALQDRPFRASNFIPHEIRPHLWRDSGVSVCVGGVGAQNRRQIRAEGVRLDLSCVCMIFLAKKPNVRPSASIRLRPT